MSVPTSPVTEFRSSTTTNRVLAALPPEVLHRLSPALELVHLETGTVLFESNTRPRHVYFPVSSLVSLVLSLSDGRSAEIATVGIQGLVGIASFLQGETAVTRALVQIGGNAYRMPAPVLQEELTRHSALMPVLLRYTLALFSDIAHIAACNRYHSLDQRLCRLLLTLLDRVPVEEFSLTQELIAYMLGVQRVGVTIAAGRLQASGLIKYSRGRIRVLDRGGLEKRVCECYQLMRRATDAYVSRG